MSQPKYKRILIKISGESLVSPSQAIDLSSDNVNRLASQIKEMKSLGVEVAIVIGGGNIWRGSFAKKIDPVTSDYMGMMATMINSLALQSALELKDIPTRVQSAIMIQKLSEPFIRRRAIRHLEKGRVVIFACGTGNPFFTTDTASVLRAAEIDAEIIVKATKVDGIYSDDPQKNSDAVKYYSITFEKAFKKNLKVMDATAFSLCMEKNIPIVVLNMNKENNILKAVLGEKVGTVVKQ
ncbi:MAG: UMP kinase [bacterium]|nr:UMP kinase [bacterium]